MHEKVLREALPNKADRHAASAVGAAVAARALAAQIPSVHWEKPKGKRFHGKLAALIHSMREAGLPLGYSTTAAARYE